MCAWPATAFAAPTPAQAPPAASFEGNWIGEWFDTPEKGKSVKRRVSVSRATQLLCNGKPFNPVLEAPPGEGCLWMLQRITPPTWAFSSNDHPISVTGRSLTLGHPAYGFIDWGATSELQLIAANEVSGRWTKEQKGGAVRWRRAVPQVTRIDYISGPEVRDRVTPADRPGRVELTYDRFWSSWQNNARGNRQRFQILIYGEHLWGHHVVYVEGLDLEAYRASTVPDPDRPGEEGLRLDVVVWPSATPGRKILHVDDRQIPFDLVIKNFPGGTPAAPRPKVVRLRYLRSKNDQLVTVTGAVTHGELFYVEATFDAPPAEREHQVRLSWEAGGGGAQVTLKPTADPKVFRSEAIRLQPPQVNR
jgi:hypothetical protein